MRFYSSTRNPSDPKPESTGEKPESTGEEGKNTQETDENYKEKEAGEKEPKENADAEKEAKEDEPIEEPEWKTSRAGTYQKQQTQQQERKISKGLAWTYFLVGVAGVVIISIQMYDTVSTAYRENSADPNLVYRRALEQSIKDISDNQRKINRIAGVPCIVEEAMVQCQAFGKATSIAYPLLQSNTAARVGTVYVDLERDGDFFHLTNAYVDFVWGRHIDLVKEGMVAAERYSYNLFDPEFSMSESMRIMMEQAQQQYEAQQGQQPQQPQQIQR